MCIYVAIILSITWMYYNIPANPPPPTSNRQPRTHFFVAFSAENKALSGGRRATRRHLGAQLDSASPRLLRRRKGTKSVGMAGTTTSVCAIWENPG